MPENGKSENADRKDPRHSSARHTCHENGGPLRKPPFGVSPMGLIGAGSFLIELDGKLAVRNSSGQGEEWGHPCGINPINGNLAVSQGLTTALNGACFQKSHGAVD